MVFGAQPYACIKSVRIHGTSTWSLHYSLSTAALCGGRAGDGSREGVGRSGRWMEDGGGLLSSFAHYLLPRSLAGITRVTTPVNPTDRPRPPRHARRLLHPSHTDPDLGTRRERASMETTRLLNHITLQRHCVKRRKGGSRICNNLHAYGFEIGDQYLRQKQWFLHSSIPFLTARYLPDLGGMKKEGEDRKSNPRDGGDRQSAGARGCNKKSSRTLS